MQNNETISHYHSYYWYMVHDPIYACTYLWDVPSTENDNSRQKPPCSVEGAAPGPWGVWDLDGIYMGYIIWWLYDWDISIYIMFLYIYIHICIYCIYIYYGGYNISYIYTNGIYMYMDISWLVGGIPTPLKSTSSSVGIMTFPIEKIKFMFQTTNQMGISWDMGKITINNGDYICILTFYVDAYREYSRIYVYVYVYI